MRVIPGMTVLVPCDAKETVRAVEAAAQMKGPVYLRLARPATRVFEQEMPFEIGKANILREGSDVALFACGIMVAEALDCAEALAKQGVEACVVISILLSLWTRSVFFRWQNSVAGSLR